MSLLLWADAISSRAWNGEKNGLCTHVRARTGLNRSHCRRSRTRVLTFENLSYLYRVWHARAVSVQRVLLARLSTDVCIYGVHFIRPRIENRCRKTTRDRGKKTFANFSYRSKFCGVKKMPDNLTHWRTDTTDLRSGFRDVISMRFDRSNSNTWKRNVFFFYNLKVSKNIYTI